MGNIIINALIVFVLILAGLFLYYRLHPDAFDKAMKKGFVQSQQSMVKTEILGKRMRVQREGNDPVNVNLYVPHLNRKLPVVFILHGGQFVDGDADQIDTFCDRVKDLWESVIVSINYAKLDKHPFPYQQEQVRDTVLYFALHASEYNIDIHQNALVGFSGGALIAVGASVFLRDRGFQINGIVAVDPYVEDSLIRLTDVGAHPSPAAVISASDSSMKERIDIYRQHLDQAGIDYTYREYPDTVFNFVEHNNPEFSQNRLYRKDPAISEEQEEIARACELHIGGFLEDFNRRRNDK